MLLGVGRAAPPAPSAEHQGPEARHTAFLVLRFDASSGVRIGHGEVRPIAFPMHDTWVPVPHPNAPSDALGPRPRALLLVSVPRGAPVAHVQTLPVEPASAGGDVLGPWQTGSLLVRAPWFGVPTTYRLLRVSPEPAAVVGELTISP